MGKSILLSITLIFVVPLTKISLHKKPNDEKSAQNQ